MLLRERTALVALVSVSLVSACTSREPEPAPSDEPRPVVRTTPPATPSPTPTSSPTSELPAVPTPPPEISRTDDVGAAAAATYFLQLYSYMMQTGDVAAWDAMSLKSCGFCKRAREFSLATVAANQRFSGAEFSVVSTFVHPIDPMLQAYPVDLTFTQTSGEQTDANGEVLLFSPADKGVVGVDIAHLPDGWKVLAVTAQDD